VESLARGLAVVGAFAPERQELSLTDIAHVAGVTVPSALRIAYTLVELGYLTRNPATRAYRPGPRGLTLAIATLSSMSLVDIADPYLAALRDETGETTKMAVIDGTHVIYVARYPSPKYPASTTYVGSRIPAFATSTGRALLARLPEDEMTATLLRTEREQLTLKTIVDMDALISELRKTRRRGYALNDRGVVIERRSIAAAVTDVLGHPVAAVSISASANRVSLRELEERLAPPLLKTTSEISSLVPPRVDVKVGPKSTSNGKAIART
jgi:IclR family transcriptional regulator, pca regulon regulatory protein